MNSSKSSFIKIFEFNHTIIYISSDVVLANVFNCLPDAMEKSTVSIYSRYRYEVFLNSF